MWGGEAVNYRSWAVLPSPRPLERQLWRTRDVDLLELALDEYVEALGRYVGTAGGRRPLERGRRRPRSPFKGLSAFDDSELDALFFFGRESEREVIVANVVATRLTVLYGTAASASRRSSAPVSFAACVTLEPDAARRRCSTPGATM